jgi:hypothetical protein
MTTALLRHTIRALRLRPDAPWPSLQAAMRAEICARQVESDPMKADRPAPDSCPVSAPLMGQIVAFPVAACRRISK